MATALKVHFDLSLSKSSQGFISQIESWINSNSSPLEKNTIWRVGLCDAEHQLEIESKIRSDISSKHFRKWSIEQISIGVRSLSYLTKSKSIFKSPYHNYSNGSQYLFAYKVPCPFKHNFYHALHF